MSTQIAHPLDVERAALMSDSRIEDRAMQVTAEATKEVLFLSARVNDLGIALKEQRRPEDIEKQIDELTQRLRAVTISKGPSCAVAPADDDDSDDEPMEEVAPKKKNKAPANTKRNFVILLVATSAAVGFKCYSNNIPLYVCLTTMAMSASKCLMGQLPVVKQIGFHSISLPLGFLITKFFPQLDVMTVATALFFSNLNKASRKILSGKEVQEHKEFQAQVQTTLEQASESARPYMVQSHRWYQVTQEQVRNFLSRVLWGTPGARTLGNVDNV
jgi:hypothetical protein